MYWCKSILLMIGANCFSSFILWYQHTEDIQIPCWWREKVHSTTVASSTEEGMVDQSSSLFPLCFLMWLTGCCHILYWEWAETKHPVLILSYTMRLCSGTAWTMYSGISLMETPIGHKQTFHYLFFMCEYITFLYEVGSCSSVLKIQGCLKSHIPLCTHVNCSLHEWIKGTKGALIS